MKRKTKVERGALMYQGLSRKQVLWLKQNYPSGTKLVLDYMDDPVPVARGSVGIVQYVDDIGTIHCIFNGRLVGVCPEVDRFHKIV